MSETKLALVASSASKNLTETHTSSSIVDWHRRFGHISGASIKLMARRSLVIGLPNQVSGEIDCESCILAKQTLMHFRTPSRPVEDKLDLIHFDINGPWNTPSLPKSQAGEINPIPGNSKYCLVFVDDFSGMSWVYFYAHKDKFPEVFIQFKNMVENQTDRKIKRIRSDQALEFHSKEVTEFTNRFGIIIETSAIYAHEQNGKAERMNRTLKDMGKTIMIESCLPEDF